MVEGREGGEKEREREQLYILTWLPLLLLLLHRGVQIRRRRVYSMRDHDTANRWDCRCTYSWLGIAREREREDLPQKREKRGERGSAV
jgi:hypothetical protein